MQQVLLLAALSGAALSPNLETPQAVDRIHLPEGFMAELLYSVPKEEQGSWVAITKDDSGRLYVSDQGGRGLFRVTPAAIGEADAVTRVERVPVDLSGAQGMCWAFGALYTNGNGKGLWRVSDTDGDDQLDLATQLIPLGNGGEHGPHAVIPTEDGEGLYFLAGNHTSLPPFEASRGPSNWSEDLLLPRQWDARGHARGKLAPGGWIARCDPDGGNVEVLSTGYRNQYDIALNAEGEMFTYDADMEWDMGTPWYRPTRVCHVTSGSEFGWRSGSGKWPLYYEDSLPPVLDIGPGSPVGIVFGRGAAFPARYQEALYLLDWTFGTIHAVHLEPDGASYTATREEFAWAKPLGVTDAIVGDDGAFYFTVGGRGSDSALYRIRYTGSESTEPVTPGANDSGHLARAQRRALEALHGHVDPDAVAAAWPALASEDRFIRFAARVAVESQPVETWRERALAEGDARTAGQALVALARQGGAGDQAAVVAALGRLGTTDLEEQELLTVLRAYALAFIRLGEPDEAQRARVIAALDPLLPSDSIAVNTELTRLLTYLRAPSVVPKALALIEQGAEATLPGWAELIPRNERYGRPIAKMLADMPPIEGLGYAFILRNATEGWTLPLRQRYFEFFVDAARHPGGSSYAGFLGNMRSDAEVLLSVDEQRSLAAVLGKPLITPLPDDVTPPSGPGREWSHADAVATVGTSLTGRSHAKGRNLFHAASCSTCHRFDGVGGAIGPDLTTVANKFSIADLLEAVVEPSKVISDQYGSHIVVDHDGRIAEGIVVEEADSVVVYARDVNAEPATFDRDEIATIKESTLSQMPSGLIDTLNPEELRDLVAYLLSGGDEKAAVFARPDEAGDK